MPRTARGRFALKKSAAEILFLRKNSHTAAGRRSDMPRAVASAGIEYCPEAIIS
jgi:hypothetical protein